MRLLLALWLAACGANDTPTAARVETPAPRFVRSNVLRADYAGSSTCTPCHRELAQRFARSPMHRMTRTLPGAEVRAPFDGAVMRYRDHRVTMDTVGEHRYVRIEGPRAPPELYRVTKVIGGRAREDFVGVFTTSTDPGAPVAQREVVLPASFVFPTEEWRYKGYSVMTAERPYPTAGPAWRQTCILCHNTAPHIVSLYDDLLGDGAPKYQGSLHGNLLPDARRWTLTARDPQALGDAVRDELALLGDDADVSGTSPAAALVRATDATFRRFDAEHLVELGIGCEACHNGSREHVRDPRVLPTFELMGPLAFGPERGEPSAAAHLNRTCARCHSVLFSAYPHTWEGGSRQSAHGGAHINSGEARDFLLGGCADAMTCTRCHDAHALDDASALERVASPEGNALCVECHRDLAGDDAYRAHAHHEPGACVSCHMPRKNMGLGYRLTRYHRIGSPNDPDRVHGDRPMECALCHTEESAGVLVDAMERWWGERYDRARIEALYGSLDANVIDATLERGAPHEVAVAVAIAAEAGHTRRAPLVAAQLGNEIPLVRYWAREALTALTGRRADLDMSLPAADLAESGRSWLNGWE